MLGKRFQPQCNHEICTNTLLFSTKCWGCKWYYVPPVHKLGGHIPVPLINSVPGHCTKVRGLDILRNRIVSGYVIFYEINKFIWRHYFFIIDKMSSRAGWNGFAGHSLETPGLGLSTDKLVLQTLWNMLLKYWDCILSFLQTPVGCLQKQ